MASVVGIDLGTTYSAIAHVDRTGRPVILANDHNERITPSVVCFRGRQVIVGTEAKDLLATGTLPGAAFFKRRMGNPDYALRVGDQSHGAIDLSALVLAKLKQDAEARLGQSIAGAVITVPAYFRDPERRATIAAGEKAGLRVLQTINEPTAAAVAYGFGRDSTTGRLLVYDLGGGTFDVTLLELEAGRIQVVGSDGDHELGGKDWDERIMGWVGEQVELEHGWKLDEDAQLEALVRATVEHAKHRLSQQERVTIAFRHQGRDSRFDFDCALFETLTKDLLDRTLDLTRTALRQAGWEPASVRGVLPVGGSTRMPMVLAALAKEFGKAPLTGVNADEAVALGAAIVAHDAQATAQAQRLVAVTDVTTHSLGMIAVNADGSAYVNSIILPKNRALPCAETRPYQLQTQPGSDGKLEVYVTQGESETPTDVAYLGRYVVSGIPRMPSGPTVLDVTYRYDVSGVVGVGCQLRVSGTPLTVTVDALPEDVPERFTRPPTRTAARAKVTAYLAFDVSGSMTGAPLQAAKAAALGFLRNIDLAHATLGVLAFSDRVAVKLRASQNAAAIQAAIDAMQCGETGFGNQTDPFVELEQLLSAKDDVRFAVVLADGVWDQQALAITRAQVCHARAIQIVAIGFGSADAQFLRAIASSDEAALFTSMGELEATFSTIAQVITAGGDSAKGVGQRLRMIAQGGQT
jgi:molecular chaperone DnaK